MQKKSPFLDSNCRFTYQVPIRQAIAIYLSNSPINLSHKMFPITICYVPRGLQSRPRVMKKKIFQAARRKRRTSLSSFLDFVSFFRIHILHLLSLGIRAWHLRLASALGIRAWCPRLASALAIHVREPACPYSKIILVEATLSFVSTSHESFYIIAFIHVR